jgi:Mn2+/Fe2+ NRAMP family transporter
MRTAVGALLCILAYVGIALAGPRLVGTDPRLLLVIVAACAVTIALWHTGFGPYARRRLEATRDPP